MFDPTKLKIAAQWNYTAPLMWCRYHPSEPYVYASSEDRSIQRWQLSDQKLTPMTAHESWVRDLVFADDGKVMISAGCDDRLIWWPALEAEPKPIRTVEAHRGWIRAAAVSPDGKLLASGGNDRIVKLWSTETGELIREMAGHTREVYSLLFDPSGGSLLSGDLMGEVRQWEVGSGKEQRKLEAKALHSYNKGQRVDYGGVRSMAWSHDGKHLFCGGLHKATNPLGAVNEPIVLRFDWEHAKLVASHVAAGVRGTVWRICVHSDGTLIACSGGSGGGFLIFWKDGEKETHKLKLPDTVRGMDLNPTGDQIATALHRKGLCIVEPA